MIDFINPRETVIVTCRAESSQFGKKAVKDNAITIGWHTPCSMTPERYAICVRPSRFSHQLIKTSKVFAVNFIPEELKEAAVLCGSHRGEHMDKLAKAGLKTVECEKIDCPALADSVGFLECRVIAEHESGTHTVFVGEVLRSVRHNREKRLFHVEGEHYTTL